jgi:hypothetical protein
VPPNDDTPETHLSIDAVNIGNHHECVIRHNEWVDETLNQEK